MDELTEQVPLRKLFHIDGTDIPVDQRDDDASWNYDHSEAEYYYGYGCYVVTAANNIPVAAAFTPAKKVDQETAMCVTREALAIKIPRWMVGDLEFDMLEWYDHLLTQAGVPVAPYNPRNTEDPLEIEYRVENQINSTATQFVSGRNNSIRRMTNAHGWKQRLVSARISASGPREWSAQALGR